MKKKKESKKNNRRNSDSNVTVTAIQGLTLKEINLSVIAPLQTREWWAGGRGGSWRGQHGVGGRGGRGLDRVDGEGREDGVEEARVDRGSNGYWVGRRGVWVEVLAAVGWG